MLTYFPFFINIPTQACWPESKGCKNKRNRNTVCCFSVWPNTPRCSCVYECVMNIKKNNCSKIIQTPKYLVFLQYNLWWLNPQHGKICNGRSANCKRISDFFFLPVKRPLRDNIFKVRLGPCLAINSTNEASIQPCWSVQSFAICADACPSCLNHLSHFTSGLMKSA